MSKYVLYINLIKSGTAEEEKNKQIWKHTDYSYEKQYIQGNTRMAFNITTYPSISEKDVSNGKEQMKKFMKESEGKLGGRKIVIRGHGSTGSFSKLEPAKFVKLMIELGYTGKCQLDLTGCHLGENPNLNGVNKDKISVEQMGKNSFAKKVRSEFVKKGIYPEIHAYTGPFGINKKGLRWVTKVDNTGEKPLKVQINKGINAKIIIDEDGDMKYGKTMKLGM